VTHRQPYLWLGLVAAAVGSAWGQQVGAGGPRVAWAHVTYLTLSSAYVDAGTDDGLAEGSRLEVRRGDSTVAILRAHFVATHRASCDVDSATVTLAVGDSARFIPLARPPDSTAAVAQASTPPSGTRGQGGRLQGRVGLYYLTVRQLDGTGATFAQPSGDVRLTGSGLGGSGIGLLADVRSRRVTQTRADGLGTLVLNQTRVYQAALSWRTPGSPLRIAAGRQFAPGMPPVGLVDGLSAQLAMRDWTAGVFAGAEPEPVNLGFSGSTTQFGGSLERHSRGGAATRWSLEGGLAASYVHGATNRQFLYLQGQYATTRVSLYAAQEVDYYGPSRRVGGEQALSPTSSFVSALFRLTDGLSVTAGLDNRRNVRLYRDVVNPETTFDDTFRRGAWVGLSTRLSARVQASFDVHTNRGGAAGPSDSYTLLLGATPNGPAGLALRSRSTRYTTVGRTGWLESVALSLAPWGLGDLQLSGGWRAERDRSTATTTSLRWVSADVDVGLARSWYFLVSGYREWGGFEAHALVYGGLSYRF
jgi:hypothetical protein